MYVPEFLECFGVIEPSGAEARLFELLQFPGAAAELAAWDLVDAGMLEAVEIYQESFAHRLDGIALENAELLTEFGDAWAAATGPRRIWMAELIGDWAAAYDASVASGDPNFIALTRGRMESCRVERLAQVHRELADGARLGPLSLDASGKADDDFGSRLGFALTDSSWCENFALKLVERLDDPVYSPEVRRLFDRARSGRSHSEVEMAARCARFLARHHHGDAAGIASVLDGLPPCGEASLLALEYMPDRALPVIRRELRPSGGREGMTVAAMLAIIDRPWSRDELRAALRESANPDSTMFIRAALRASTDPDARDAVGLWELCHPPAEPEFAPRAWGQKTPPADRLREQMRQIRHRVEPLRDRTPGRSQLVTAARIRRRPPLITQRATGKEVFMASTGVRAGNPDESSRP